MSDPTNTTIGKPVIVSSDQYTITINIGASVLKLQCHGAELVSAEAPGVLDMENPGFLLSKMRVIAVTAATAYGVGFTRHGTRAHDVAPLDLLDQVRDALGLTRQDVAKAYVAHANHPIYRDAAPDSSIPMPSKNYTL